ncbi:MAG: hypothetical protein AB7E32_09110 [Desulfovibrio sp.]
MTLRPLTAEDLVKSNRQALAFLDTPEGAVLASGPVRPISPVSPEGDAPDPDVTFHLGRNDASEYAIRVIGHGSILSVRRTPSPERIALREINLPADRPVLLLVEAPDEFEPEGLQVLARLVDGLGRPPLLHPGSILGTPDPEF